MINKCAGLIILFLLFGCGLNVIQLQAAPSDTQNSKSNTVSMIWCVSQIEKVAKTENDCRSELSKTTADLQREKSKKNTVVEKLGILAIGSGLAFTNFNPLGCLIAGYLILFQ